MVMPRSSHRPARGPVGQVEELFASVKDYARQETLEPLRGAVRWVGVGSIAALSLGLALVYVSLGHGRVSSRWFMVFRPLFRNTVRCGDCCCNHF